MIRRFLVLFSLISFSATSFAQLVDEDFESYSQGSNFPTSASTTTNYQIDQNTSNGCGINDSWEIESPTYWTPCSTCSGNVGSIRYSFSCDQDFTLVTKTFTANSSSINISFNYGFYNYSSSETLTAYLYNESNGTNETTLISINGIAVEDGSFNQTVGINSGDNYTIRFNYVGSDDWGATIDNILVEEACGPSVTFSQNCNDATNYNVTIVVNSLNGNSIDITNGSNTIESNVGTGTYIIENLTGLNTITVTNDVGCSASETYSVCDLCENTSAPSDLPCDAPSVDLSQPFVGTTNCSYTATSSGTRPGPDDMETGCPDLVNFLTFNAQNDSWLTFTAADDSVILDWTVSNCQDNEGVQFAILDGVCTNEDEMEVVDCEFQAIGSGTFDVGNLVVGESYFIYIDGYSADICDYSWTPQSGVAITPPNDTCGNATEIACGDLDTSNNILASNIDAPAECLGLIPDVGVWYKYIGNGTDVTISTDNIATNFDTQLFLYSGDCNNLNCLASDDNSGNGQTSKIEFTADDGIEYYIYVGGDGSSANPIGQFGLSVTCVSCDAEAGNW
tara:strand:- start:13137 stop:14828 length:1692 start_codon:yes stop_codon:yes gene_type:complete